VFFQLTKLYCAYFPKNCQSLSSIVPRDLTSSQNNKLNGLQFFIIYLFCENRREEKKNLKDHLSSLHCVLDSSIYIGERERAAGPAAVEEARKARGQQWAVHHFFPFFFSARRVGFAKHAYKIYIEEHDAYIHT